MYENGADYLNNNLRLNEISILIYTYRGVLDFIQIPEARMRSDKFLR